MSKVGIKAIEIILPKDRMTVDEMAKTSGISAEDLFKYTGVESKPVLKNRSQLIGLCSKAAHSVLKSAGVSPTEIGYVLFGSSLVHDRMIPSAVKIQKEIGAKKAFSFDVRNGCNSGNLCLQIAKDLLGSNPNTSYALIVLGDPISQVIDYSNPDHLCLFAVSDAACAILVKKGEKRNRIVSAAASTNADFADHIHLKEGEEHLWMNSDEKEDRAISKEYETRYTDMIKIALDRANLKTGEIDHLFMNQGDHRLIDKLVAILPIDSDKVFRSHKNYGHIGASDCFLGLKSRLEHGEIKPGQNIVLASSAVGFSWGATVIKA